MDGLNAKKTQLSEALQKASSIKEQAEAKPKIEKDLKDVEGQIDKSNELLKKLQSTKATKEAELADLKSKTLKEDEKKVHLLLVDLGFVAPSANEWTQGLRDKITLRENKDVPIIFMGYNEDLIYIQKMLVPGVKDYFIKPVDVLLLKHNMTKLAGQNLDDASKIYEIESKAQIKILRTVEIKKMSEFEMTVLSPTEFKENEFIEFFADLFNMQKGGRLLARCMKSDPDATQKGAFRITFSFVGLSAHNMNEIRKWLRTQYVTQKQSGG